MLIRTLIAVVILADFIVFLDRKKNNKAILFISVMLIGLVMGGAANTPDYHSYANFYESGQSQGFEPLYSLISWSAAKIGIPFQWFMAVYMSAAIMLVVKAAQHYRTNWHLAVIIYLLTSAYINTCVMRQCMSYALYVAALNELAEGRKFRYCVMILAGVLFHTTTLIALPMVFFAGNRNAGRSIFWLVMCLCAATFLNDNRIPGIGLLGGLVLSIAKLASYFTLSTNLGFMYCFALHFTLMFIAKRCLRYIRRHYDDNIRLASVVFDSTVYFTVVLPLCMHSYNFIRVVYFNMIPVMFTLSAAMKERYARKRFLVYAFILIAMFEFTSTYGWVREMVLDSNILEEYFTVQ